jgi:secreted trypsin-like serine protease
MRARDGRRVQVRKILALAAGLCATAALAAPAAAAPRPARIVGGAPAAADTAPWTAFLVAHGRSGPAGQFCGASVVAPTAVVTAAHCVVDRGPDGLDVVAGQARLSGLDGQRLQVSAIDVEPGYDPTRTGHDVAVVHLASPTTAPAIGLATPQAAGLAAPGARLLLSGWGLTANADDATPDQLHHATVTAAPTKRCRADYGPAFDAAQMICTTGGLPDACRGDSGGPLVSLDGPAPTLVGVVSFGGQHCGDPRFPGVYARVSFASAFLARALGEAPAGEATLRERIGHVGCSFYGCTVTVRVTGDASAVNEVRVRIRRAGGYDHTITADPAATAGVYQATARLPLGRLKITAVGVDDEGSVIGHGDAVKVRVG